jgi:hypothetical protein
MFLTFYFLLGFLKEDYIYYTDYYHIQTSFVGFTWILKLLHALCMTGKDDDGGDYNNYFRNL